MSSQKIKRSPTLLQRACEQVPDFTAMYTRLERKIIISGQSTSTLTNYGRSIAKIALYFGKTPLDLSDDQIADYLLMLKQHQCPSPSYFKHTVYGIRYLFRLFGREDRAIELPSLKSEQKLPVVLSKTECRKLFAAPRRLKHRVLLALIYSAGLRLSEVIKLRLEDIDSDRMQIRIRQGKGRKDRYVVLSVLILSGLRKYYQSSCPKKWLFNGRRAGEPLSRRAVQWVMRRAKSQAGINKEVSTHSLRHSYATHLLEDGVDLYTIKEQLGHSSIETTLLYLHIAQTERKLCHSPLDSLYGKK